MWEKPGSGCVPATTRQLQPKIKRVMRKETTSHAWSILRRTHDGWTGTTG